MPQMYVFKYPTVSVAGRGVMSAIHYSRLPAQSWVRFPSRTNLKEFAACWPSQTVVEWTELLLPGADLDIVASLCQCCPAPKMYKENKLLLALKQTTKNPVAQCGPPSPPTPPLLPNTPLPPFFCVTAVVYVTGLACWSWMCRVKMCRYKHYCKPQHNAFRFQDNILLIARVRNEQVRWKKNQKTTSGLIPVSEHIMISPFLLQNTAILR